MCVPQYNASKKWKYLCSLYRKTGSEIRPWQEHVDVFQKAGFALECYYTPKRVLSFEYILENSSSYVISGLDVQVPDYERQCLVCDKVTERMCLCGETFCSKKCQLKCWKRHKNTCENVNDDIAMFRNISELWWRVEKEEGTQCLVVE